MYINNENNKAYPNLVNDLNEDIDCEKLFDKGYAIAKKYLADKNGLKSQNIDATNYERDDFIILLETNPNFLDKNGKVSSAKFVDYSAKMILRHYLLSCNEEKRSKINMEKEYNAARKLLILDAERHKEHNNRNNLGENKNIDQFQPMYGNSGTRSSHPLYGNSGTRSSHPLYGNSGARSSHPVYGSSSSARSTNSVNKDSNVTSAQHGNKTIADLDVPFFYSGSYDNSYSHVNDVHNRNNSNRNTDTNNRSKNKINNSNNHNKKSKSKRKEKRTIKGFKKSKRSFYKGLTISLLIASLSAATIYGTYRSTANSRLINSTSYQTAQSNSIPSSMYLSNRGDENSLLHSPMFGGNIVDKSKMFSDESEFDNSLLKTYVSNGNCGINNYIFKELNSGEMHSINALKNLAKANEVFSLSVMQDEFINALGENKDSRIKYASYDKTPSIPDDIKSGDYVIRFYDKYGTIVPKSYYSDKFVSQYIKNFEKYVGQINTKFDSIDSKSKINPNYTKSIDCYKDLIEINELISKSHIETNTFAIRNHEKRFSLPDNKIVTKGVDFSSKKDVDNMKINLNYDNDKDDDGRDGR